MEKGGYKNSKIFVWILGCLLVLIVGLTVGIVIVNLNKNDDTNVVENSEEEVVVTEEDLFEGETMEDAKKRLTQDKEWDVIMEDIESRVAALLNSDPIDVDAINKIYNDGIERATSEFDRHDYVVNLIVSRTNGFLSKGLKQEALDALLTVDPGIFDNVEKYYYYTNVINIAKELNNQSLVDECTSKRSEIEEDFLEQSEATRRFAESVGADTESYVGKDKQ